MGLGLGDQMLTRAMMPWLLAVGRDFAGVTKVLISHQEIPADLVLVLDQGRLVEMGPPADLRRRPGGVYATLFPGAALFPAKN